MVQRGAVLDTDLTIRFKHGNQTIFLFVDPVSPLSAVQEELLSILNERYPDGITTSASAPKKTGLPEKATHIRFALPQNSHDFSRGWRPLSFGPQDCAADKGIKDNMSVAFAFAADEAEELNNTDFNVEFPSYEEDMEGGDLL
ncbi:hypothetical protein F5Y17DRAFT_431142 [Xylariaceae sp. FL0594]|nr:hypothetical protein F5Y17DRAFT_431142 [Xylariaceae sp. FL0594]